MLRWHTPPLNHRAKVRQKREIKVNYRPYLGTELSEELWRKGGKWSKLRVFDKNSLQNIPMKWGKIASCCPKHVLQHIFGIYDLRIDPLKRLCQNSLTHLFAADVFIILFDIGR